jgi:ribosomal protein S18 acetylase RimI-like enzyme
MQIRQIRFSDDSHRQAMLSLVRDFPAGNLHVVDLPYRFSSPAFDDPDNVGVWVDASGRLVAWGVLQPPFWSIDYACHPDFCTALHPQLLDWADRRASRMLNTPAGHPAWFVSAGSGQTDRLRDLEQAGFTSQANVGEDSGSKVLMRRPAAPVADDGIAPGLTIRPLRGEAEVEAYVELHQSAFQSRNMTAAWRARTLRQADYLPDLDLVAAAEDGRLAGFCVCWLSQSDTQEAQGQIEPMGVHKDFRRRGLGRALLAEGLRRLQRRSARQVYVETDNYRDAAFALYQSMGFRVIQDILIYRKDYQPAENQQ